MPSLISSKCFTVHSQYTFIQIQQHMNHNRLFISNNNPEFLLRKYRGLCLEKVSKWQADWSHSLSITELKRPKNVHSWMRVITDMCRYVYAYVRACMNTLLTNPKRSECLHFGFYPQPLGITLIFCAMP